MIPQVVLLLQAQEQVDAAAHRLRAGDELSPAAVAGVEHEPPRTRWLAAQGIALGLGPHVDHVRLGDVAVQVRVEPALDGPPGDAGDLEHRPRRG